MDENFAAGVPLESRGTPAQFPPCRGGCGIAPLDLAAEPEAAPTHGLEPSGLRANVTDRATRGLDGCGNGRVRDDTPVLDRRDQFLLRDETAFVLDHVGQ